MTNNHFVDNVFDADKCFVRHWMRIIDVNDSHGTIVGVWL